MAKLGEGDPRWIVNTGLDGKNVNNWHWTALDCTPWSKAYFHSILKGKENNRIQTEKLIEGKNWRIYLEDLKEMEGEVTMGNRKSKIYYIYDLTLKLSWKAEREDYKATDEDSLSEFSSSEEEIDIKKKKKTRPGVYSGTIVFKDIMHDMDPDDMIVEVACDQDTEHDRTASSIISTIKSELVGTIRKQLATFPKALVEAHANSILLPVPDQTPVAHQPTPKSDISPASSATIDITNPKTTSGIISTSQIELEEEFFASAQDVFACMTDPGRISIWTGAKTQIELKSGSPFSMFNGEVNGILETYVANKLLVQKWRLRDWPEGHYSLVRITLEQNESRTHLKLVHSEIPSYDVSRTQENWHQLTFNRIKGIFGMGGMIP
jgi:activator of HSP90 ATPase